MERHGFSLDLAGNDIANAKKLAAGHLDLLITTAKALPWIEKMAGINGLKQVYRIKEVELGLACNRNISDAIIDKLNAALKQAWSDGSVDRIILKY